MTIGYFEKKILHLHNVYGPVGKISDHCESTSISYHSACSGNQYYMELGIHVI